MALFEGSPAIAVFGEYVEEERVSMLGLVPSLVSAWRAGGCIEENEWSGIRCFSSTGECSYVDDMTWLMKKAHGRPVIEYCGGTDNESERD